MICEIRYCSKTLTLGNLVPLDYQIRTRNGIKKGVLIVSVCDNCLNTIDQFKDKKIGEVNVSG